jgi:hypothetical protein
MKRQYFGILPIFSWGTNILEIRPYFHVTPIFRVFANILGRRQYFLIWLDFVAANIFVYFQYLSMHFVCTNIFGAIVLKLRFKIDVVVMIIWSIVIIINSVLTLQVSTASLSHDREPCEIKVVSNHTCSLHIFVCAGSRRVRVRLSGFRRQGISSTPGGFLKCPIPIPIKAMRFDVLNFNGIYWHKNVLSTGEKTYSLFLQCSRM